MLLIGLVSSVSEDRKDFCDENLMTVFTLYFLGSGRRNRTQNVFGFIEKINVLE